MSIVKYIAPLAAVLMMIALPFASVVSDAETDAAVAEEFEDAGITFNDGVFQYRILKGDNTVEVVGFYNYKDSSNAISVDIGDTVYNKDDGISYKILGISRGAFAGNLNIASVSLGSNLYVVKPSAFHGCKNIESITFHYSGEKPSLAPHSFDLYTSPLGNAAANAKVTVSSPGNWAQDAMLSGGTDGPLGESYAELSSQMEFKSLSVSNGGSGIEPIFVLMAVVVAGLILWCVYGRKH